MVYNFRLPASPLLADSTKRSLRWRDCTFVLRDHSSSSHSHISLRVPGVCQDVSDLLHHSGRGFVLRREGPADGLPRSQHLRGFRPGRNGFFRQNWHFDGKSNDLQVHKTCPFRIFDS